jgi:hypothetical protein
MRWLYNYLAVDAVKIRWCPRCVRRWWHFDAVKTTRVLDVCCRCDRVQADAVVAP